MEFEIFGRGWWLGLAIAAPVGPIGILCIKRTLARGWRWGVASGLGAATADGIYGCIAGFGWVALAQILVAQQLGLRLAGGSFLIYLGIRALGETWTRPTTVATVSTVSAAAEDRGSSDHRENRHGTDSGSGLLAAYGSTLALTLTNPMTVLSFTAIFAGAGVAATDWLGAALLVSGVFSGSACWWLLLCGGVGLLQLKLSAGLLLGIQRCSAVVLLVFGLGAIASLLT